VTHYFQQYGARSHTENDAFGRSDLSNRFPDRFGCGLVLAIMFTGHEINAIISSGATSKIVCTALFRS
jgi:hypothetical protein